MARTKQTRRKIGKKRGAKNKSLTAEVDFTKKIYGTKYAPIDSPWPYYRNPSHKLTKEIREAQDELQADMSGNEDYSSEEEGENCEILWDKAVASGSKRSTLSNVSATVERCCLGAIYVSLNTKGAGSITTKDFTDGNRMAVLYPGKAYVNARRLLIDVVKSNRQLRMIIPIGSEVFVDAHQNDSSVSLVGLKDTGYGKAGEILHASWEVDLMWPKCGERPRDAAFRDNSATFENREASFKSAVAWTLEHALASGDVKVPRCVVF